MVPCHTKMLLGLSLELLFECVVVIICHMRKQTVLFLRWKYLLMRYSAALSNIRAQNLAHSMAGGEKDHSSKV